MGERRPGRGPLGRGSEERKPEGVDTLVSLKEANVLS